MNAIVVVDKNWNIGRDGDLLVHLPGDLKYYKEKTLGKTILIGRKTLESFPGAKPLPGRTNIVLTGNPEYKNDQCVLCCGMESLAKELTKYKDDEIYVSGGEMIYDIFLDKCETVYVTKIFEEYPADKSFKNLDEDKNYEVTWVSDVKEEKGIRYQFVKYERK
ncbi:MAG: dihydrofolate reductase [Anaerovoracaceae bacterium]